MKDKHFKNIIHSVKKVSLSQQERSALFDALNRYAESNPSVRSPYSFYAWKAYFSRPASYVVAGALVVLLSGSGVVFASQDSLPGDVLYPIKVHVSEPIKEALAVTADAKQKAQVARVQERLNEAEELAVQDRLASSTSLDLKKAIKVEIDSIKGGLSYENKNGLETALSAHGNVLESIKKHVPDDVKVHIDEIQTVLRGEDGDKEADKADKADKQATTTEVKIVPAPRREHDKAAFPEKKGKAEKAIKDVSQKIEASVKEASSTSALERDIIDIASSSIQNAQDNLKQAEDVYMKDDDGAAADVLIHASEKKAQEASISVDRGLELGKLKGKQSDDR